MRGRRLILLAPIHPAAGGNGLAMRTELFRQAAGGLFDVETVVIPVSGQPPAGAVLSPATVVPNAPDRRRAGMTALIADPVWRRWLATVGELPSAARAASPGLAQSVVEALDSREVDAMHVMRAYLAPLGVAVAQRLGVGSLTLDLDEDDAAFAAAAGDQATAAAYGRLLDCFADRFDALSAASGGEARSLSQRHGLAVEIIPNAIVSPARLPPRPTAGGPGAPRLLFVGNLTYAPNVEAATRLVRDVAPLVRRQIAGPLNVRLVGPHGGGAGALAARDVEVSGFVAELWPQYAVADAVVVPLRRGGGTRIKLLEAFAFGVPVVASTAAAAGLEVSDGRHLLLADTDEQMAAAVVAVLTDPALGARLAEAAARLVRERYRVEVVIPVIRRFLNRAAALRESGRQALSP